MVEISSEEYLYLKTKNSIPLGGDREKPEERAEGSI